MSHCLGPFHQPDPRDGQGSCSEKPRPWAHPPRLHALGKAPKLSESHTLQ